MATVSGIFNPSHLTRHVALKSGSPYPAEIETRVAPGSIAVAPPILLLDEATSSVDSANERPEFRTFCSVRINQINPVSRRAGKTGMIIYQA